MCRLAFVTTLLVTKVARGKSFEQCGNTCDGGNLLVRRGNKLRYVNCDAKPFAASGNITSKLIADDITALNGNPADVTVVTFPCLIETPQQVYLLPEIDPNGIRIQYLPNLVDLILDSAWIAQFFVRTLILLIYVFFSFLVHLTNKPITNTQQHNNHSYYQTTHNKQ